VTKDPTVVGREETFVSRRVHGERPSGIEDLGDRVNGFVSSLRTYNNQSTSSHRSVFQEMHQHKQEARADHKSLLGKFARTSDVIDKKFVQLDTELEKVVGLVGDKIEKEVGKIATEFAEAMEVEEEWRATSESKVVDLEAKLEAALEAISSLMTLVISLQGRVGELEDAVMEEASDVDGEGTAASTSLSEFDPVENMVAIPIPPPIVTLIPIEVPEAFIPPSLRMTPSPLYVASREEDPENNGVPEYWADPAAGPS
jgi:predicted transcriptional regulator